MGAFFKKLKRIRVAVILFCVDVFLTGQGFIAVISFFVILFNFFPKALAGLIESDNEKFRKYAAKAAIYFVMCAAIFSGIFLNNKIARYQANKVIFALERYKIKHRQYPGKLDELVPEFLSYMPLAKLNLNGRFFYYASAGGQHLLMYIVLPPFARAFYNLEEKKWSSLD